MEKNNGYKQKVFILFVAILFICTVAINLNNVNGANYTVATYGNDTTGDGDDTNPFCSLGLAIDKTNNGEGQDNIIIKNGTYKTYGSNNNVTNLIISKNVSIYSSKYLGESDEDTILDGENWGHFFTINYGATLNLYGIILQNGKASYHGGGAIYSDGGISNIYNTSFINCNSGDYNEGGAIFTTSYSNNWVFENVSFLNCSTAYSSNEGGGAICSSAWYWSFLNVNFTNCSSTSSFGGGGAIYNTGKYWSFEYVNFINCSSFGDWGGSGGAIYGGMGAHECSFINTNFINCSSVSGGAVYVYAQNYTFISCEFIDNQANDGAAIYLTSGSCNVSNSVFSNNVGNYQLYNSGGSIIAENNLWDSDNPNSQVYGFTVEEWIGKTLNSTNINVMDVSANYSDCFDLIANLSSSGLGLNNKTIEFYLNNVFIGNSTTDSNGIAIFTYNELLNPGTYKWSAKFGHDLYYNSSSSLNATITIINQTEEESGDTTITIPNDNSSQNSSNKLATKILPLATNYLGAYGNYTTLNAILYDSNNKLLVDKNVEIWVDGIKVATVKTTSKGLVSYNYKVNKTGNLVVEFKHLGDSSYLQHSAMSNLSVKKHSKLLIINKVKKGKAVKLISSIKNSGPDKLTGKVTYKLAKGLKVVKVSKKLGNFKFNKKKRTITFTLKNFAKSSKKVAKLTITFDKSIKGKKYVTNKVASGTNTFSVSIKNK